MTIYKPSRNRPSQKRSTRSGTRSRPKARPKARQRFRQTDLDSLDQLIQSKEKEAEETVRLGRVLRRLLKKMESKEALALWLQARYGRSYGKDWVNQKLRLGAAFQPNEVRGKIFADDSLDAIRNTKPAFRRVALRYGSGRSCKVI